MNAVRVCKLRNGDNITVRVCKLCNGVNITPQFLQFLLFSMAKDVTKTIAHLSIAEDRDFEA